MNIKIKPKYLCTLEKLSYACALLTFIVFTYTLIIYPLSGEDFGLTQIYNSYEPLSQHILNTFRGVVRQYQSWNARLGEALSIISLSLIPGNLFWVFGLFVSVGFVLVMIKAANVRLSTFNFLLYSMVIIVLWPLFELFTWKTIVGGYLAPMTMTILYLAIFLNKNIILKVESNNYFFALSLLLGFLVGASFENVPPTLICFIFLVLFFNKKLKSKLLLLAIAPAIGWLNLVLAPSTIHRIKIYKDMFGFQGYSFEYFYYRSISVIQSFGEYSLTLLCLSIVSLVYLGIKRKLTKEIVCLYICSLIIIMGVISAPYTEVRAFMLIWCVMIIVIFMAINQLIFDIRTLKVMLFFVMSIVALITITTVYKKSHFFAKKVNEREVAVHELMHTDQCEIGIPFKLIRLKNDFSRYINNRDSWVVSNLDTISHKYYNGCVLVAE